MKSLTPNTNVDNTECRRVITVPNRPSENTSDQKTKYSDMVAMNIAWNVDMALHHRWAHIRIQLKEN